MAHEVYQVNGKDSMAYVGATPWHGLGQALTPGADIDTWVKEAGLEWSLLEATPLWLDAEDNPHTFPDHKILYRSDTLQPMQMVNDIYKPVQPREVVEFFRDLVEAGNMTIETAGSLRMGRIIWALARIGEDFDVQDRREEGQVMLAQQDMVNMYALLATSCDRSLSSTGRLTHVRVVCNNTLDAAYGSGLNIAKVTHRTLFDEVAQDEVKKQMGLVHEEIENHKKMTRAMATASLKKEDAIGFFLTLLSKRNDDGTLDISNVSPKAVDKLYTAYKSSPGSDLDTAKDTLWGAVNAVSYSIDHNPGSRSDETRLDNAWFGSGRKMKADAYTVAVEVVEEKRNVSLLDSIIEQSTDTNIVDELLAGFNARNAA